MQARLGADLLYWRGSHFPGPPKIISPTACVQKSNSSGKKLGHKQEQSVCSIYQEGEIPLGTHRFGLGDGSK